MHFKTFMKTSGAIRYDLKSIAFFITNNISTINKVLHNYFNNTVSCILSNLTSTDHERKFGNIVKGLIPVKFFRLTIYIDIKIFVLWVFYYLDLPPDFQVFLCSGLK